MNQVNSDPGPDIEQAWVLANQARSAPSLSPMEDWLAHWLMAFLYQWRDNDFSRSVAEARKAVELAPYDSDCRSDLSWILANAGHGAEAIAWARSGLEHDPNGPSRYRANLAWAYYVAGRDHEATDVLGERSAEFPVLYARSLGSAWRDRAREGGGRRLSKVGRRRHGRKGRHHSADRAGRDRICRGPAQSRIAGEIRTTIARSMRLGARMRKLALPAARHRGYFRRHTLVAGTEAERLCDD